MHSRVLRHQPPQLKWSEVHCAKTFKGLSGSNVSAWSPTLTYYPLLLQLPSGIRTADQHVTFLNVSLYIPVPYLGPRST